MIVSKPLWMHYCLLRGYSSFIRAGRNRLRRKKGLLRLGVTLLAGTLCFYGCCAPAGVPVCVCDEPSGREVAVRKSRDLIRRVKIETGAPGIVVGVSVNGKSVWQEGFGYADIENRVPCTEDTVMRIASISKSITMAAVAKLWEEGKLDLDKPVQDYVPYFPEKMYDGKKVDITCRQLVSHLSGIRHYDKNIPKKDQERLESKLSKNEKENKNKSKKEGKEDKSEEKQLKAELELKEYFIKDKYESVKTALDLFKDDPLMHKPGTKFLYTTHGWTLVSAVVEAIVKEPFDSYISKLFKEFGMTNTYLDVNEPLIYNRSRHYCKDKKGQVQNTPYIDNSYKWAGGGFLSTVGDLLKFGNIMLYSLQHMGDPTKKSIDGNAMCQTEGNEKLETDSSLLKQYDASTSKSNQKKSYGEDGRTDSCKCKLHGYLNQDTVKQMWSVVENTTSSRNPEIKYGMGWSVILQKQDYGYCREQKFNVSHTGLAVGACSILLVLPRQCQDDEVMECKWEFPPQGTVVAILSNLQGTSLRKVANEIAALFANIN